MLTGIVKFFDELFEKENNTQGQQMSDNFVKNIEAFQEARKKEKGNPQLDNFVRGAASIMLRLFLGGI